MTRYPGDLDEAAKIDGCTKLQMLKNVLLPTIAPGIFAASALTFIVMWNDFMFALYITGFNSRTLPVEIYNSIGYYSLDWGKMSAIAVVAIIPAVLFIAFAQKYIVKGAYHGGGQRVNRTKLKYGGKKMKFGTLFAYWTQDWHGDYIFFAKKAKDIGFDILEISAGELIGMPDDKIKQLRDTARDLEIEISSNIGPPKDKDIASKYPEVRKAGIDFLTKIMQQMDKLGSRALVGVLNTYWPCEFDDLDKPAIWARGVESVKTLGKIAQDLGIDYCLEVVNRFESNILNTSEEAVRFAGEVGLPSVKILLDTFHMNIEEDNIADAIRHAGAKLGHLHVGEGNRNLPGKGSLPWKEIGTALKDIDFNGGVVMEPFVKMGGKVGDDIKVWRDISRGADERQMDEDIRQSLAFLKEAFR